MPEPMTCCVVAFVVGGGGVGAFCKRKEIAHFLESSWDDFSRWAGFETPVEEQQRIELAQVDESQRKRQMERRDNYHQLVEQSEATAGQLHQDTKKTIVKIESTIEDIGTSASIIGAQASRLIQMNSGMEVSMSEQTAIFEKLEKDLREKINQLDAVIKEKSGLSKKLTTQEQEIEKLKLERGDLIDSQKKLSEQMVSLKKMVEQQDRQLEERDRQLQEIQESRGNTASSSRPRFFTQ